MKLGSILNKDLNEAIAAMGHGDLMIVCDAGFPIPRDAWRIDLAIKQDLPDLKTVLELINGDMYAEKVVWAEEVAQYNPNLEKNAARDVRGSHCRNHPHRHHPDRDSGAGQVHRAHRSLQPLGQHSAVFRRGRAQVV